MANIKSAKKRIRSSERRRVRNRVWRSSARTFVRKARTTIDSNGDMELAEAQVRQAIQTLDKAARKGVIHPRNAARRKSRLMAALAKAKS
ncbi:MAG: 30S ribosomal protein S20 [Anaerolineales bacterium]|nr:30S ribosomal protein S20 [Anaerolineales bacterium]MCB0013978.1 30S ribosomal protein S20 [Anaerolineales bacterium]MCB0020213.1 30S ribosomal protein S20 [Anaerolineales bacterium]